ncbi:MAG: hypothetical protein MJ158_02350 [Alphaproteobacteria bacterium]|nr:hypothetical protein [Alphaproteobacteria bacterium]
MTKLATLLFKKPIIFSLINSTFLLAVWLLCIKHKFIFSNYYGTAGYNLATNTLIIVGIGFAIYKLIKHLHDIEFTQTDAVATINAITGISFILTMVLIYVANFTGFIQKINESPMSDGLLIPMIMYIFCLFAFYVFGLALVGLYIKYNRAKQQGISKWKFFCSWPFCFLLIWAPGYLITEKKKPNILISSKLYNFFHNWVMKNQQNLVFIFIFMVFLSSILATIQMFVTTIACLILYKLWTMKYKDNFLQHINKDYATMAVILNFICIMSTLFIIKG